MGRVQRRSKGRVIKPTFFVFCEGETEEAYISFIRRKYRVPIEIRTHVARNKIKQPYVNRILKSLLKHKKDKYFLLYDLDVPEMLPRLQSIRNSILLCSNPCIELWFILHTCNHSAEATSLQCLEKLERICKDYKKGSVSEKLRHELLTGEENACSRAGRMALYSNPSTSVFRLIEELKKI